MSHETSQDESIDDETAVHKESIKHEHCAKISEYADQIKNELDNTNNLSHFIKAIQEELNAIEARGKLIDALKDLNESYQKYKQLQQQQDAAEKRFQNVLAIFSHKESL